MSIVSVDLHIPARCVLLCPILRDGEPGSQRLTTIPTAPAASRAWTQRQALHLTLCSARHTYFPQGPSQLLGVPVLTHETFEKEPRVQL